MKHTQIILLIVVAVAVLITAVGVGFYIKEARDKNRQATKSASGWQGGSRGGSGAVGNPSVEGLMPARASRERLRNLSEEDRAKIVEERQSLRERWASMSAEEKEKFREQLRERFNVRRRGEQTRAPVVSPAEMADVKGKWENMTEQEREDFRAKMRERFRGGMQEPNAVRQEPNAVQQEPPTKTFGGQ